MDGSLVRRSVCRFSGRLGVLAIMAAAGAAWAAPEAASQATTKGGNAALKTGTSITIYSSARPGGVDVGPMGQRNEYGWNGQPVPGYAVVREVRTMNIAKGRGEVKFTDVAAQIDPTTVSFSSLTDPAASVLEQNYQFDLVSPDKLLNRFIDSNIVVNLNRGDTIERIEGTLLSSTGGMLVLRGTNGLIRMLSGSNDVSLPSLPEGLITRPTLLWDVESEVGGQQEVRVGYQTRGITWWTDYNLVYADGKDANHGVLDVGAWVSILNQSGGTYSDATLKLVAGDVNRAPVAQAQPMYRMNEMAAASGDASMGFQEKSFFEYHLYTLGRPATIPDNSTKQVELFPAARGVPCEKVLVYDAAGDAWWGYNSVQMDESLGSQSSGDVDVYLRFVNSQEAGLGMPLPAGRIRVNKLDGADGSLEFIGEDVIGHTPKDEKVLVKLGKAFDVVGERTQKDFRLDSSRKMIDETYEIKVRNRKDESVTVIVEEHMNRWSSWEIVKQSAESKKIDSRTVQWEVTLEPGEEKVLNYSVRYTW